MANKNLFKSSPSVKGVKSPITKNAAGGNAYQLPEEIALAKMVVTGCMNNTFYVDAKSQMDEMLALANKCSSEFLAKLAVYARQNAYMKDSPALLCAVLAKKDVGMLKKIFMKVIDNGKMLRNFVQIIRSGVVGRVSLGTAPKKLIQAWFDAKSDDYIFRATVGNDPSIADVIKLSRPKPHSVRRNALYGYILGRKYEAKDLPPLVKDFIRFKETHDPLMMPDVPFQMLTAMELGVKEWTQIAQTANWTMTRMNLNTFQRHGVFNDKKMISLVEERLRDKKLVHESRVFPYQMYTAFRYASDLPVQLTNALQDALDHSLENIPAFDTNIHIGCDISGSMQSPITGHRGSVTSKINCVDVAGLISSALLRKNPSANVTLFNNTCTSTRLNSRDSVMTNTEKISKACCGGTDVSSFINKLNNEKCMGDLVIIVSDNESWISNKYSRHTDAMVGWNTYKKRNPNAKLICIDITPSSNSQFDECEDVYNIGGFSDDIFTLMGAIYNDSTNGNHLYDIISRQEI